MGIAISFSPLKKMKSGISLLLCLFFISCDNSQKEEQRANASDSIQIKKSLELENLQKDKFLNQFKNIEKNSFIIDSPSDECISGYDSKFNGEVIDSIFYKFIPDREMLESTKIGYQIYACGKFTILNELIALLIRSGSSTINLFIYDKNKGQIINKFEVSELYCDEKGSKEKYSLINNNDDFRIITLKKECWRTDFSKDSDTSKFICLDSIHNYKLDGSKIGLISSDSISDNNFYLVKQKNKSGL
jgi:hypothetical protein